MNNSAHVHGNESRSPKVKPWHLQRRPSSTSDNRAPAGPRPSRIHRPPVCPHRARLRTRLGPSQIAIIDDDLGRSGQSAEGRPGFQRFLAESRWTGSG